MVKLALLLGMALFAGCAGHRESQRSRDRLYCVYAAKHTPGLTPPQLERALKACQ